MTNSTAHELGHTYGLSVDARLKTSWVCAIDWPVVGQLPCGAVGGFDEYKNDNPCLSNGNPSSGFWVRRGDEPASVTSLPDQEQCESHCFMGSNYINAQLNWPNLKSWIDAADYDHLIDKLKITGDPEVIYLSGMIAFDDRVFLGQFFHLTRGKPDLNPGIERKPGLYAFQFLDAEGRLIQDVGLPVHWTTADYIGQVPVTFFGLLLPYPSETRTIQLWNRKSEQVLEKREVSLNLPSVNLLLPLDGYAVLQGDPLSIEWKGMDADGDALTFTIAVSLDGRQWWPAAYQTSAQEFLLPTDSLIPGAYHLKIIACDGVHVTESSLTTFIVQSPERHRLGDCNQDGNLDISDGICLLGFLFQGNPSVLPCGDGSATDPSNLSLLDFATDNKLNLSDAVAIFGFLFLGESPPAAGQGCVQILGCPAISQGCSP